MSLGGEEEAVTPITKQRRYEAEWADALVQEATRGAKPMTWLCWLRHRWMYGEEIGQWHYWRERRCERCGRHEWQTRRWTATFWRRSLPPPMAQPRKERERG